ncbi:MAG: translation elongation factor Ts [Candidatus Sumerlaeia bacterium]
MSITPAQVKELRDRTGAGFMQCKEALAQCGGDTELAVDFLRKKGQSIADKKALRQVKEGIITAYIHPPGKLGVLLELNCETDFVARNESFQELAKNLAMQIAAANPSYISRSDVPAEVIEKERQIYAEQARSEGKPDKVVEKIVAGRLEKYYQEHCLLEQEWVRDPEIRIQDLITQNIARLGENIVVSRFVRYQVGEKFE